MSLPRASERRRYEQRLARSWSLSSNKPPCEGTGPPALAFASAVAGKRLIRPGQWDGLRTWVPTELPKTEAKGAGQGQGEGLRVEEGEEGRWHEARGWLRIFDS